MSQERFRVRSPAKSVSAWFKLTHFLFLVAVVECYQTWCGPCKAIQGTFKRIYFDAGDKPLKFFTVRLRGMHAQGHCSPMLPPGTGTVPHQSSCMCALNSAGRGESQWIRRVQGEVPACVPFLQGAQYRTSPSCMVPFCTVLYSIPMIIPDACIVRHWITRQHIKCHDCHLFIQDGKVVEKTVGVQAPVLSMQIATLSA